MITTHCVFNFFQAEIKYLQYPAWGYVIYTLFVLIPVLCIIYPPIKDYVAQRRSESENSGDSLSTVCERCCYFGRSRSFDLEQSTSCVNGHVNQSVQADWSKQKNQEEAFLGWKKLLLHNMANRVPRGKKRTAATVAHSSWLLRAQMYIWNLKEYELTVRRLNNVNCISQKASQSGITSGTWAGKLKTSFFRLILMLLTILTI